MLRQFLVGGGVSLVNIAIHALVMTIVVRVAQNSSVKTISHPSLFLIAVMVPAGSPPHERLGTFENWGDPAIRAGLSWYLDVAETGGRPNFALRRRLLH